MKLNHWLVVAAVAASWPGCAQADNSTQVYGQELVVALPDDWVKVHDSELGGMHSLEFVPQGQHLVTWSELICIQAFQGVADRLDATAFLESFSQSYQDSCKGEWTYQPLGELEEGVHAFMGCSRIADQHSRIKTSRLFAEMGYYQVIAGENDLYLIHRSSRGADFNAMKSEYQSLDDAKAQSLQLRLPSN